MNRRNWLKCLVAASGAILASGVAAFASKPQTRRVHLLGQQLETVTILQDPWKVDLARMDQLRTDRMVYSVRQDGRIYLIKCRSAPAGRWITTSELNQLRMKLGFAPVPDWSSRDAVVDSLKLSIQHNRKERPWNDNSRRPITDIWITESDYRSLKSWSADESGGLLVSGAGLDRDLPSGKLLGLNFHYPATISQFA